MKTTLLLMFSLLVYSSHAQAPWRAKLIVYFEGPNETLIPDTIWVGCDSAGGEGFQPGLDVLADSIEPYHIYSLDTTLPGKYLRTNIKGFKKGVVTEFKMKCRGNAKFIVWDSLEYNYENDTMFMLYSEINANELVSFDASHRSGMLLSLYPYWGDPPRGYYYNDSIEVIEGGLFLEFDLLVKFQDSTMFSGLITVSTKKKYGITQVGNSLIKISGLKMVTEISLHTVSGELISTHQLNKTSDQIPIQALKQGMYLLYIKDSENRQQVFKFIK